MGFIVGLDQVGGSGDGEKYNGRYFGSRFSRS